MIYYKGASLKQYKKNKSFSLTDIDLVKEDLLNHIKTVRGERVKMPDFGTNIPDMAFEQLDDSLIFDIELDLREVFDYDPRVTLNDLRIIPIYEENALLVTADLFYVELEINDVMEINLEFES